MALIDWALYSQLLEDLNTQSSKWKTSKTYLEFSEAIKLNCPELLPGEKGLTSLEVPLTDNLTDQDVVYAQIRLTALAVPAELTRGPEWAGYYISSRPNGDEVCSEDRYAIPSAWEEIEDSDDDSEADEDAEEPENEEPGLTLDEETGLLFDSENWYLPDGKTVVTQVGDSDVFVDDEDTRYRRGVAFLWFDSQAKLFYDDVNWYLGDGTTIVTQVGNTDVYADSSGTRYRLGVAFQWFDSPTNLLYDDDNWYLADGTTVVTQVGDSDVYADGSGRQYRLGQLLAEPLEEMPELEDALDDEPEDSGEQAEITEMVRTSMAESIDAAIREIRDLDIGEDELSEDDIAELVAQEVERLVLREIGG